MNRINAIKLLLHLDLVSYLAQILSPLLLTLDHYLSHIYCIMLSDLAQLPLIKLALLIFIQAFVPYFPSLQSLSSSALEPSF